MKLNAKTLGPVVGVELAGGYASNWAYDKHKTHQEEKARAKHRPNSKKYPSSTKECSICQWDKSKGQ